MELPHSFHQNWFIMSIQLLHSTSTRWHFIVYVHWRLAVEPPQTFPLSMTIIDPFSLSPSAILLHQHYRKGVPQVQFKWDWLPVIELKLFFCWFTLSSMSSMKTLSNTSQQKSSLQKMILTIIAMTLYVLGTNITWNIWCTVERAP